VKKKQLQIWKTDKVWNLTISESKVKYQLLCDQKATEEQLTELQSKRLKLQREVDTLNKQVHRQ